MNPYIIGPYTEDDAFRFWGRSQEIESMYKSFMQNDYLVCYANSGEGKSSILNAGLFPKLRNSKYCPINIRFKFDENEYSDYDFDRIINDIIDKSLKKVAGFEQFEPTCLYESEFESKSEMLWQKNLIKESLWLRLRFSELSIRNIETNEIIYYTPVLVFDQFEEVFTNPKSEIWTKEFFRWLEELSTDVCPEKIVRLIEDHDGEVDMSMVPCCKRFKAIFSLRSEYVGNVDYWGLQHYYIPDLKNNRYFLKPLKPAGAVEVIKQPEGFPQIPDKMCENIVLGCGESKELIKEQLPCIPASILSIICHELYNLNNNERNKIAELLVKERNSVVESILENYYLRTLSECGIKDDKTRDAFEKALVDDKGNRKRIGVKHKDLQLLSEGQIKQLTDVNMLRVVSKAKNNSDIEGDIVELPHDRFCKFIANHKNKRFEEIQAKNRILKEWLLFGITNLVLGICAWRIHSVFIDLMKPVIDMCLKGQITKPMITKFATNFITLHNVPDNLIGGYASAWCILIYALLLPCLFFYLAKKHRYYTLVISVFSILISLLTLYRFGSLIDGQSGTLSFIAVLASLGIVVYLLMKWKSMGISDVRSWPIWGGWTLFSFYMYSEFLFGLKIGISSPFDSWYFVILIPILVFLWSASFFRVEEWILPVKSVKNGKSLYYIFAIIAVVLLYIIAANNNHSYMGNGKLSKNLLYFLLSIIGLLQLCLLWKVSSISKRIVSFIFNYITFIIVFTLNLGYNFIKINYNNVARVANWRSVYVKDSSTNLYGICNPINGEIVFPLIIDKDNLGKCDFNVCVPCLSNNQDTCNSDSSFFIENNIIHAKFFSSPTLESYIYRIKQKNPDKLSYVEQIDYYAVKLFEELRSANIDYLKDMKSYPISRLSSWEKVSTLQLESLENELKSININKRDTIWQYGQPISRSKYDVLEDDDIRRLYCALARSFFLCSIRDRVTHCDIPSVFTLTRLYALLFFTSVPLMDYTYNSTTNINVQNVSSSSKVMICSQEILEKKAFAWYYLFNTLCTFDIGLNTPNYVKAIENTSLLSFLQEFRNELNDLEKNVKETVKSLEDNQTGMSSKSIGGDSLNDLLISMKDFFQTYNQLKTNDNKLAKIKKRRKSELENISIEIETVIADKVFKKMQEKVFEVLLPIMNSNTSGIYNNAFEMTCKNLLIVQIMRLYNVKQDLEKVSQYDTLRNQRYNEIEKLNNSNPSKLTNLKEQVISQLDLIK